jgi:hypothetical protein
MMVHERVFSDSGSAKKILRFRWHSPQSKWLLLYVVCTPIALEIGWHELLTSRYAQTILAILASGFLYVAFAGWFNSSTVTLDGEQLTVKHGPFPWPGNHSLHARTIRALEVVEHYVQTETGQRLTYRLIAKSRNGEDIRLISAFNRDDHDAAEYIRKTLAEWLGIKEK